MNCIFDLREDLRAVLENHISKNLLEIYVKYKYNIKNISEKYTKYYFYEHVRRNIFSNYSECIIDHLIQIFESILGVKALNYTQIKILSKERTTVAKIIIQKKRIVLICLNFHVRNL
ncbi:hypothetical protein EDEG_03050 [Edhazardia aedis USNM 41457]|uniref:Uncharacterized protein n=1 Tax=Edhazardia aedis (strain USNM 41457) TaxID=1003232 RepID=J8ZS74_EDHAE|nr:hypothetical protein EDEG_03050 [Edhazardia aedis USNM 41457]|eukprot:EJW02538.1 hypothetical protein EDEG_03050 [Edhazardia aedis USNM 41457]